MTSTTTATWTRTWTRTKSHLGPLTLLNEIRDADDVDDDKSDKVTDTDKDQNKEKDKDPVLFWSSHILGINHRRRGRRRRQ